MPRLLPNSSPVTVVDLAKSVASEKVSIFRYTNNTSSGVSDYTAAITNALADLTAAGGGTLYFPGGYQYPCELVDLSSLPDVPLTFEGDGWGQSQFLLNNNITPGKGWWNRQGKFSSRLKFTGLGFNGQKTTPTGLTYSAFGSDPMHALLTTNSTFWFAGTSAGDLTNIWLDDCQILHSDGYLALLDARTGNVKRIWITNSDIRNNRGFLFGTSSGDESYGCWQGIHYQMDGISASTSVQDLRVEDCDFSCNTGNMIWGHAYALNNGFHEDIHCRHLHFSDIGDDCIEMGQVDSCSAVDITIRRGGYISLSDDTVGTPKWQPNLYAVGIDTSGIVRNFRYQDINVRSMNGGVINGDGLGRGSISGVTASIPLLGEQYYTTDSVALMGPGGAGANYMQGIVTDNSANAAGAGDIEISDIHFFNYGGSNVGLYAVQNCSVHAVSLNLPATMNQAPIAFGNQTAGANQRAYSNTVSEVTVNWSPAVESPVVVEDPAGFAFSSTDQNWVANIRIIGNGNAYPFQKDPNTISTTGTVHPSNYPALAAGASYVQQTEGRSSDYSMVHKWYALQGAGPGVQHMSLQAYWAPGQLGPLLNVSAAGVGGVVATGARTGSLWSDAVLTSMGYLDGFLSLTDTTYSATNANAVSAVVGGGSTGTAVVMLMRYHGSVGYPEVSTSITSGVRDWGPFTAVAPGANEDIIYNKSGALFGDSSLQWNYTTQNLVITGGASTFGEQLVLDTASTGQQAAIIFNSAGAAKWQAGMGSSPNYFFIYDVVGTTDVFHMVPASDFWLTPIGDVLIGTGTNDSSTAKLQVAGFISASSGYYSVSTSYQAFKDLTGGINTRSASIVSYLGMSSASPTPTSGDSWASGSGILYYNGGSTAWTFTYGTGASTVTPAYIAALGLNASGTLINSIQVALGGVTAAWLYASDSLFFAQESAPALSASGQARIYFDSTAHLLMASLNAGAYVALSTGGISGSGASGQVAYFTGTSTQASSANFAWNNSSQLLTITASSSGSAGIACATGYIQSDAGFLATSGTATSYQAIQAAGGGLYALSSRAAHYMQMGQSNGAPGSGGISVALTTGDSLQAGAHYWDTGLGYARIYNGSSWLPLNLTNGTGISITGNTIANTGVTSLGALTGALNLGSGTGVSLSGSGNLTINIGQAVGTGSSVTFGSITSAGVVQSQIATGTSIAFQTTSPFNFQVNGNGVVSCQQVNVAGSTAINGSKQFVGAGVAVGNNGIGGSIFSSWVSGSSYSFGVGTGASQITVTIASTSSFTVAGGIITSVTAVSDSRLKTEIGTFLYGLDAILKLRPVFYSWNAIYWAMHQRLYPLAPVNQATHIGFYAQDVIAAMPERVGYEKNGYYGFNKDAVIASLVVAVQQLKAELDLVRSELVN